MRVTRRSILFLFFSLQLASCSIKKNKEQFSAWYEETYEEIKDQADETADSTYKSVNLNSGIHHEWFYYEGHIIKYEITFTDGTLNYRALYATDSNFRIVQEYCADGKLSYEGIEYKHKPYGLGTWYYCQTGKIMDQGLRLKFQKTGSWIHNSPDGTVLNETFYKEKVKISSLPELD